jgi:hypothetical protein
LEPNNFHPLILEKADIEKQVRKEEVQPKKNQDAMGLIPSKPATISDESISWKKPEERENLETKRLTKAEEFNIVDEYFGTGKSQNGIEEHEFSPKTTKAEEFNIVDEYFRIGKSQNGIEEHEFSPKTHCQYFFGYLSTKNKEEAVPETCFDCPKSIECMLKEYDSP